MLKYLTKYICFYCLVGYSICQDREYFTLRKNYHKSNRLESRDTGYAIIDINLNLANFNNFQPINDSVWVSKVGLVFQGAKEVEIMFDSLKLSANEFLEIKDKNDILIDIFSSKDCQNILSPVNFSSNIHSDTILINVFKRSNSEAVVKLRLASINKNYLNFTSDCKYQASPSDLCNDYINCSLDSRLTDIKNSVVHVVYFNPLKPNTACTFGSGVIINNLARDYRPLLYTAKHVIRGNNNELITTFGDYQFFRIYFNYEKPNCTNNLDLSFFDKRANYVSPFKPAVHL